MFILHINTNFARYGHRTHKQPKELKALAIISKQTNFTMQPKISVIVPVYKAEKYLHRCVDSILAQTFTNFELLLINDGSPDNSGAICDEYAIKDKRVHVFHKENGGVSSARNLGLDNAKGEWIAFVDADDWVEENYLEDLSINIDTDFIIGGFKTANNSVKREENVYTGKQLIDFLNTHELEKLRVPWGNLLNRDIIEKNKIRFDKKVRYGEDTIFNLQYICHCNSIRTTAKCGYYYCDDNIEIDIVSKYNLSIEEVSYSLNRIIDVKNTFAKEKKCFLNNNFDFCVYLSMCPIHKMLNKEYLVEYYNLCKHFEPTLNNNSFYSHSLFSPIVRGIAELKSYYERKNYIKAEALFNILHQLSKDLITPNFKFKDFYIWYYLIKHNCYNSLNLGLKLYFYLKSKK